MPPKNGACLRRKDLPNSNHAAEAEISYVAVEAGQRAKLNRRAIPGAALEGAWQAPDGDAIRRIDWPAAPAGRRGSLLFLPGRGDFYEKYLETLDHWWRRGWRVTALDWRGQAGSGRLGLDATTGHVDDFAIWLDDLSAFWREWREMTPGPHVLAGHSMGGHLVLRAVAEGRVDADALVLSAPMLGLLPDRVPTALLLSVARLLCRLGDSRRAAWQWGEKPGALPRDRAELLTHDAERYADELAWRDERPELDMGSASWGWIVAALESIRTLERRGVLEGVATPAILLGTERDGLVSFRAIARAARRLPQAELVRFGEESRHEILREVDEVRERALAAIDEFLDRAAARDD